MPSLRSLVLVSLAGTGVALAAESDEQFPRPTGPVAEARILLAAALEPAADESQLRTACEQIAQLTGPEGQIGALLQAALADSEASADALRTALSKAQEMLAFEPLSEAALPEGFPTYTPAGAIEVKQYPARRLAKADGFWTLFRHITTNDIAMTTPVQMDYAADDQGRVRQRSMAFYYGSGELGEAGRQGAVEVVDDQPQWVVSLGVRGWSTRESIADAKSRLEAWLKRHPEYEIDGDLRVMGYNSPMVRGGRQFHEVQLPVRKTGP